MKKVIAKIFKKKKSEFPTSLELLASVMNDADVQNILSFCPDKRELYEAAALALSRDVSELIADIAEFSGYSRAARVLPMDIELLPEGISLEHLKRIGAIGVTVDGVLQGVVAVDPALVKKLFPTAQPSEIMLASWKEIQAAILASEKLYAEKLRKRKENDPTQKNLVKQVFDYMHSEMLKYQANNISIDFLGETISYTLRTADEKEARGAVHASFARGMLHFLKKERDLLPAGLLVREEIIDQKYMLLRREVSAKEVQIQVKDPDHEDAPQQMASNVVPMPERRKIVAQNSSQMEEVSSDEKIEYRGEILIVDDNRVFRDVLTRFLERKGLVVRNVDRADQALLNLEQDKAGRPALVLCDMHLPGMNGLAFVSKLRTIGDLELLPVIMLSSDDTIETRLQCLGAGADLYLQKSEDPRILCAHIVRFLVRLKKSEAA